MNRTYRVAVTLCLAVVFWVGVDWLGGQAGAATPSQITIDITQIGPIEPRIVAGDPLGVPPDSPAAHVDPNTTTSTFAGVGSLFIDVAPIGDNFGFLCSAAAIHGFSPGKEILRQYVLTAAHCLDFEGGEDFFGDPTGDGVLDVAPADVQFVLNAGGSPSSVITAAEIFLHPDWHGFANVLGPEGESVNDDVALIRLSSPLPAGIPTYNLATTFSGLVESVTSVGYGESGDPSGFNVGASFTIKRIGINRADAVFDGDETVLPLEVFAADFDGPDGTTNQFDVGLAGFDPGIEGTLGNDVETTIAPGDSGSPSFLSVFDTLDLILGADGEPIIYGVNTFGTNDSPAYGSIWGGTLVPAYAGWIDSMMVPEPTSGVSLAIAWLIISGRSRRRRRI
jgi:hypothetical protein